VCKRRVKVISDWITVFQKMGVLGIGLLMFVEYVFPPIPSELIMPLAGFSAARGERSLISVIIADRSVHSWELYSGTTLAHR
jgi:membrane protein DedA with SNARE-associated domain